MIHLVTLDFPPTYDGGVATWTAEVALGLVEAGEAVTVYARSDRGVSAHDRALPYPVIRLRGRSWGARGGDWVALQVSPLVRAGDEVIFATWPLAARASGGLQRRRIRHAVAFHGSDLTRLAEAPASLQAVAAGASCLPVSRFLLGELRRLVPGADGAVIPQPSGAAVGGGAGERGLIVVARLNHLKGVDRVLRIARALRWPVTVVGDGPARAALEALAAELAIEARFTGRLSREQTIEAYDGHAFCALLPRVDRDGSGGEGFGLTLLEAMGRGVPAVGCATGGVPEAAGPGLLLDEPDDAEGSAAAIRAWLRGGDRGGEGLAWVRAAHGRGRVVAAILGALRP